MHLLWLAVRNLSRAPYRSLTLVAAVGLTSAVVFAALVVLGGISGSLGRGLGKLGADLLVVPQRALVNVRSTLLTGEPSTFYMPRRVLDDVRGTAGVRRASPQLFLTTAKGAHCIIGDAFLVGFDPASDFTILPWAKHRLARPHDAGDAIVGGASSYQPGDTVYFYGRHFVVYARLERTGVGLYDNAIFITLERAYGLADAARGLSDVPEMGFKRGDVSAILADLTPGADAEAIRFALARDPGVRMIAAGTMITGLRRAVAALFSGTQALALLLAAGNALMVAAIFASIMHERRRELGLLRAVGARRRHIVGLVLSEAAMLTGLGAGAGLLLGGALLGWGGTRIAAGLEAVELPFVWPDAGSVALLAFAVTGLGLLIGLIGAALPACRAGRTDPDAVMRGS